MRTKKSKKKSKMMTNQIFGDFLVGMVNGNKHSKKTQKVNDYQQKPKAENNAVNSFLGISKTCQFWVWTHNQIWGKEIKDVSEQPIRI